MFNPNGAHAMLPETEGGVGGEPSGLQRADSRSGPRWNLL